MNLITDFFSPIFFSITLIKVKVLVAHLCLTLCNPMDCNPPGSSVHEILQSRILEWVAICFSRGSFWPRDQTQVSHVAGRFFTIWVTLIKAKFNSFVQSFNKYLLSAHHRVILKIWWWAEKDLVSATWGSILIQQSPSKWKNITEERVTIERNTVLQELIMGLWAGLWMTVITQVAWGYWGRPGAGRRRHV